MDEKGHFRLQTLDFGIVILSICVIFKFMSAFFHLFKQAFKPLLHIETFS